ncbi:InlB B-repeat-containing protein [Bifidobacterium longum]|uniref:InlB B-repeat-containing protein n=1 Tax=Bifidobacterium longum TaxID=216816 RepID=UPI001EDAA308|nr:InlB B-repeat-containing protein [Bifidobacterium longum]MCG4601151.1 InlB B-repeat-containing protein [Bifidobacterium longum]MCG4606725.1 InlB B-repeat-containing protein [Bifidobacterium longum]MCG4620651.1 InlB B-repeat-containing protein [Bifidobacterium longum]MCG4645997.1 InlB B-repeat-containing protein [Bifidobacterium longum]MCG4647809.1 InlB B-repeat-containing protein [Bifidobacterium longum]
MRTWLKRMVAGIVSVGTLVGGGLLMAGTANADEIRMPDIGKTITSLTASAATTYPRELVNGGFDYLPAGGWNVISPKLNTSRGKFTSVDPVNGQYIRNAHVTDGNVAWVKWDGFDASKFGWISDQKGGKPQGFVTDHANSVELQRDNDTDNTYAEIVGSEIGKSIYQKIDTQNSADAVYTVRFDHAALSSEHADGMQALVNGKPVTMTRIGGNKAGDKTGWTGTDIVTHATNTDHYRHDGQWATYEGKVTIPANTPVSTFMFKSLNEAKPDMGNLIDNLTFKIAYRLSYDSNGGTKAKASQISSMTEGKASETDGKVRTVADENVRYGSLANGDFSYPSFSDIQENEQGTYADLRTFLKSDDGTLWYNMSVTDLSKYGKIGQIPGFDSSRFAWSSTENGSRVELQQDRNTKNTYAEIVAQQDNTSIYQNVSTGNGGVLYKIRLKHASRQSSHADRMQVLVGSDTAHATPVEMTRVTSNGHGDKVGGKSTIITTKVSNTDPRDHGAQWETYEGYYQVPEGQKNTVFMFKSLEGFKEDETLPGNNVGNLVDDIEFSRSYKLTYDANSSDASGQVPSDTAANTVKQAKSKTNGSVRLAADDDVAEYAVNGLPDHLVNGDFEYPVKSDMPANDGKFWYISQNDGSYFVPGKRYKLPEGFDKAKFAWHSTQTGDTHYPDLERADDVQVNYKADGTNHYSEISAAQSGATIYQDVATVPGVMYKWSLKHASLDSSHLDKMSVIIGEPGKETAQEATRTTANGHGDKLGKVGTVISTKVSNPEMPDGNKFQEGAHTGQWETYTGTYIATGTVTRFAFHSVEGYNAWNGNLLDDISFSKAYKLTYDKNASDATGQVPSNQRGKENTVEPAESKTTGNVKTVADNTSNLPDHLVNGTFDYRGNEIINENQRVYGDTTYLAMISAKTGVIGNPLHSKLDNWDSGKFGWRSNDATAGVDTVEVQRRNHTPYPTNAGNVWGEIAAAKRGKYIYQDIATTPGVVYKWSLKHASRNADQDDSMQVMIGEPGKTVAQQATRTTSNGSDKTGSAGTTITTHGTAQDGKWETYTGDYLATSTVTRFTFRSVRDSNGQGLDFTAEGNCVDDLSFDKAYKLSYDKNSSDETGSVPSNQYGKENTVQPAKSKTTGSVGLAADKTASGLTVHDLKNDKGKVPSSSKADSTQPAAFKAPDAKVETIASRAAGDELAVNGGFDTPKWSIAKEGQGLPWVYVKPNAGTIRSYAQAMAGQAGVKAGGLTAATFAWQDLDAIGSNQNFELHREKDGNTAADVHAGRTVAQTVNTTPGASYTFSIRHSGRSKGNAGGVTLLTGPDKDHLTPVKLTRTTVSKTGQKYGDKTGDVGTVAYTHSDSMDATEGSHEPWDHSDDWESYEGTVIIPAGQSRTMIAYRGVAKDGTLTASANDSIIDDLSFRLAYRLGYDGNGGTGQVPSRTETGRTETAASGTDGTVRLAADKSAGPESGTIADDRRVLTDTTARQDDGTSQRTITRSDGSVRVETIATTGAVSGCQVYYPAGTRITLATAKMDSDCWDSSQIGKTNRTFYGWSANTDANDRDVPVADTMDRNTLNANVRTEIVMPARAKTVYALWAINPTLSYNVNAPAGSNAPGTPASQTVPYNTAAADKSGWAAGDTGKIPGYRFDGWYTAPNGGNKYDFNTPLTGNVTVYAHWVGNGYTVRFAGNGATGGGTPDQAFQYNIGQNLRRNGFTRDGYTFTGWKRADNQQAYGDGQWVTNLTTQPNGIVTMVAQWSANEAHIRYNPNPPAGKTTGGNGTPNWDGHTGDTPAIGGNGWTIDGYTFAGWTTSPDGSGARYAPGASWTANGTLTLYAQWTPGEAGLTYDGNGATGGKTDPQNGVTDQKVNVRQNGFTRDGYTFVRWDTQADCRGKAVNPGDKWTLQGSSTLYACWAGVAQTLTYHGNGATGGNTAAQSGHTGDELTTNANGFTRDGYTFVRWDTAKDGSGIAYGEGKNGVGRYTMKPAGNDLYAIWKANPATIQYRNDWPNTTGSTPDTTGNTGQDVTIAQNGFTRPGYTFTGWARDRRTNPSLQPGGRYTLTPGTTTLWAQWKADPAHLIYNSNSGSTSQTRRTDGVVDQTLTVIANPFTRTGYTFTGWNTQADGRGRTYTAGNGFRLVADPKSNPVNTSVLYAQWRINRVTLKFNPNGGTGGYPDITADAFTTVTIPADAKEPKVQRPGFRFTGWAMKPTPGAGDTILSPGKGTVSMPDRGSTTVYAQWEPSLTTLPFTGGQAQVPTIWLYAGFALMLIALGVMMPMLRMRMAATKRTGKHMPITGGKHAK